jgi:hypothetical protein
MMKDREKSMTSQDLGVPEDVKDRLDEIMEYEPAIAAPNIDDNHMFEIDNNDHEHNGDNDVIAV